jgi:hypothetical protein
MNENLNLINSELRAAELRERAELWRRTRVALEQRAPGARSDAPAVVIRMARFGDEVELTRLAQLDGNPHINRFRSLVAEVDGEILAALPLDGDRPAADPFRPTAALVEMLSLRAAELREREAPRRGRWAWLPRPFRAPRRRSAAAQVSSPRSAFSRS